MLDNSTALAPLVLHWLTRAAIERPVNPMLLESCSQPSNDSAVALLTHCSATASPPVMPPHGNALQAEDQCRSPQLPALAGHCCPCNSHITSERSRPRIGARCQTLSVLEESSTDQSEAASRRFHGIHGNSLAASLAAARKGQAQALRSNMRCMIPPLPSLTARRVCRHRALPAS
jgi:hypothetical protein